MRGFFFVWLLSSSLVLAQFSFRFTDTPGTGFLDETVVTPIGGNTATTLGEQRQAVLQRAADIWAEFLNLNGPVEIEASFSVESCSNAGGVLAFAGPNSFSRNFPNAPEADVHYVAPLVNHLTGTDRFAGASEITVGVNSAVDDDSGCLGGAGFYYGFDNLPGVRVDLLSVLLHELGHGLGFLSLANPATGAMPSNLPDSYTLKLYDLGQQRAWSEMTNAQRVASGTNDPLLVWTGMGTNAAAKRMLTSRVREFYTMTIGGDPQQHVTLPANFGPNLPFSGLSAEVVLVDDGEGVLSDACEEPLDSAIFGKIALIDRGTCLFVEKVQRAQDAGAIAVIVANNNPNEVIIMGGDSTTITIPSVMVRFDVGQLLRNTPAPVMVSISDGRERAGMAMGQLRMFAPRPLDSGSSISHWTSDASPNLLMEPALGSLTRDDPGLTLTAMKEIGWDVQNIPFPYLTYDVWAQSALAIVSEVLAEQGADPDSDGVDNFTEYLQGTNPVVADALAIGPFGLVANSSNLSLSYQRRPQVADFDTQLMQSSDLSFWQTAQDVTPQASETIDSEAARESFLFSTPVQRRFYRIEVSEFE